MKKLDLRGQPFGKLIVIEEAGRDKNGKVLWRCRCECGNEVVVRTGDLLREHTLSCGCYKRDRLTTHGASYTRLYRIWEKIMVRVGRWQGANEKERRNYIARGIDICEEWLDYSNFEKWALANGYREGLQIDRKDNSLGYCPENCHWVTTKQNVNNRRCTIRLSDGQALAEFCTEIGIDTRMDGKMSKQYNRIQSAYRKFHAIHPELLAALKADTRRQCRLLYQASMIRQEFEGRLKTLKQKVDAFKRSISNP